MSLFLVVGSGVREQAIVESLLKDPTTKVHCIGNENYGIKRLCETFFKYNYNDDKFFEYLYTLCDDNKYDSIIVGPEAPLAKGIVDYLMEVGVHCIGPEQNLAKLESSKIYARTVLHESHYSAFCPKVLVIDNFTDRLSVNSFIDSNKGVVLKCDGLCGGKGVFIYDSTQSETILSKVDELLMFNKKILMEERLYGDEFSLISITDGTNIVHAPPIMDFKRLLNGDKGPNTGSMGCIMDGHLGFLNTDDIRCAESVNESIIHETADGRYVGFLYGSFMKTAEGDIKVIEFNCRLGDPEGVLLLQSMTPGLSDVCRMIKSKTLSPEKVSFDSSFKICKYLVPNDYPFAVPEDESYIFIKDISMFLVGSLKKQGDYIYKLPGSRAIAMVASSESEIDDAFVKISGDVQYRTDLTERYREKCDKHYRYLDIDSVETALKELKPLIKSTYTQGVLSIPGSFGGQFSLDQYKYTIKSPVLVSSIDGVGTKTRFILNHLGEEGFRVLGKDIVHHNINDILVQGAKPLFFLDYFASSTFNTNCFKYFIEGVSEACKTYNVSLVGGETAEMPNTYCDNETDIVGCIVGIIEKDNTIDGRNIKENDLVFAISSDGVHTNGYSVLNRLLPSRNFKNKEEMSACLYSSHRCYYSEIKHIEKSGITISGLCHITGGGLVDNPKRVIPDGLELELTDFKIEGVWKRLQNNLSYTDQQMMRTFNCGVGMLVIVDPKLSVKLRYTLPEIRQIGYIKNNT